MFCVILPKRYFPIHYPSFKSFTAFEGHDYGKFCSVRCEEQALELKLESKVEIEEINLDIGYLERSRIFESDHGITEIVDLIKKLEEKVNETIKAVNKENENNE